MFLVVFIKLVYDNDKMGLFESMATIIVKSSARLVVPCCNGAHWIYEPPGQTEM